MSSDSLDLNAGSGADRWGDVRVDVAGMPTILADIEHLPFRPRVFDRIKLREVLEHLNSPVHGLLDLRRVMRGSMFISVPNPFYYRVLLRTIERGWKIAVNYRTRHLQAWDIITMRQLLFRVGLIMVGGRFSIFLRYLELVVTRDTQIP